MMTLRKQSQAGAQGVWQSKSLPACLAALSVGWVATTADASSVLEFNIGTSVPGAMQTGAEPGETPAPAEVKVTITDLLNSYQFTIEVVPESGTGNIGDLRGFFFNTQTDDQSFLDTLAVTSSATHDFGSTFDTNSVIDLGMGSNVNGLVMAPNGFDVGISIGLPGLKKDGVDDIRSFTFDLDYTGSDRGLELFTDQLFAVRLTSVGQGSSRGGSSKIKAPATPAPTTVVPTPSAALGGLAMLGVLGGARRRRS